MSGRTRITCLLAVLTLAGAAAGGAHATIVKRLDYESGNFRQWSGLDSVTGGARTVASPVRQGHYAARFIVRPGDDPLRASGERAEAYYFTSEHEVSESWWA